MSKESSKYKFPGDIDRDHLTTEQPIDPMVNREMQMPNPFDPIGNITMEGQAMRNLTRRRMPIWVLMAAWASIGLFSFGVLGMVMSLLAQVFGTIGQRGYRLEDFLTIGCFILLSLVPLLVIAVLFRATWRKRG
jgi:hypothetical protein